MKKNPVSGLSLKLYKISNGRPAAFLPECKWQFAVTKNDISVTMCGNGDNENHGKPCSKRCLTPEPIEPNTKGKTNEQ